VSRIGFRWPIQALVTGAAFAVLYKSWLTTPVLQYVSIGQWRLLAIVIAAACGGALTLLRFSTSALASGALAGLLFGGTWAAWTAPNDVAISATQAFASHLESLWREGSTLACATTVTAFFCAYAKKRRARSGK
jgi:predicted ribosomally synthesized peptide with SipW-like signal peptide